MKVRSPSSKPVIGVNESEMIISATVVIPSAASCMASDTDMF